MRTSKLSLPAGQADDSTAEPGGTPTDEELAEIRRALTGLRYGTVLVVVQDGVVVQIDRTDKRRLRVGRGNGE
jgi:hypothetical protein